MKGGTLFIRRGWGGGSVGASTVRIGDGQADSWQAGRALERGWRSSSSVPGVTPVLLLEWYNVSGVGRRSVDCSAHKYEVNMSVLGLSPSRPKLVFFFARGKKASVHPSTCEVKHEWWRMVCGVCLLSRCTSERRPWATDRTAQQLGGSRFAFLFGSPHRSLILLEKKTMSRHVDNKKHKYEYEKIKSNNSQ